LIENEVYVENLVLLVSKKGCPRLPSRKKSGGRVTYLLTDGA